MFDVITLGSATKDVFLFTKDIELKPGLNKHFLEIPFDKKIEISDKKVFTGGSATNAAATFAKFGKNVATISKIGKDKNGDFIIDDLMARKINTDYLVIGDGETPVSDIVVAKNAHMVLFTYRGIEDSLKKEDIKLDFKAKWLYAGPLAGESYKVLPEIIKYCKENDIRIVMNPGSNELNLKIKKLEPILADVDIISMNDEEAKRFVGYGNVVKNLVKLTKSVKGTAIITRGELGCVVMNDEELYEASAVPTKQINFVGAGDAFLSGFITAQIDGKDIEDAITLGSYNASSVVRQFGAKTGIIEEYPKQKVKIRRIKYEKK
jgi:sugar/nucleoside kinase (ribokinase family)